MEYYPFDSRSSLYRNKLGALAEGETLRLKLLLHRDAHVHSVFLRLKRDDEQTYREAIMQPDGGIDEYNYYYCDITLAEGLYWYSFRYTSDYGEFKVTKTEHSLGIVSDNGTDWQLTVYNADFETPDWLDGGIIYQIFPDRFYNSGAEKSNVPADRFIQNDWYAQPEYRQTAEPKALGNDYFGGDFKGIEEKLPYLKSLGVNCIYLNPIFEAHSNHRYNTADYLKTDPSLGTEEDFCRLINAAQKQGIGIILDGVFSHTGDDSVYFNSKHRYDTAGAQNSDTSVYRSWYKFGNYPTGYACWWGVPSLPETEEEDLSFSNFITGENGVLRYWLKKGIRGWRLDVADELPDSFLDRIRLAIKAEGRENYLLGEVWEDATNKISYGSRRRFLRGRQLDSVMNYPLASAIVNYVKGGNSRDLVDTVLDILENYPPQAVKLLMNHIGTHDTARILTVLGKENGQTGDRAWQSAQKLTDEEYSCGVRLLKLAAVLQFTLPGVPSVYYGDEAGMHGYGDPFCRAGYPWGKENTELLDFYKKLGTFRRSSPVFASGEFEPIYANFGDIVYIRRKGKNAVLVAVNRWHEPSEVTVPDEFKAAKPIFGNKPTDGKISLPAESFAILEIQLRQSMKLKNE